MFKDYSMINIFNATPNNKQLLSFTQGTVRRIQRQNDVKKYLMSQATRLAWYQSTNFNHRLFFCLIILLFAVNLVVSSMSLSLVINFGFSNYKRQFFDHIKLKYVVSEIADTIQTLMYDCTTTFNLNT